MLRQYGVPCRYMHSNAFATAVHDAAVESQADARTWIVFYIGDWWDRRAPYVRGRYSRAPSGLWRRDGRVDSHCALTAEDIVDPNLPSFSADSKGKDARFRWFVANYGGQCWELDAMSPVTLRQRVEQAIRSVIDWKAWERCMLAEEAEKATIRTVLGNWRHCIVGQASQ